MSDWWNFSTRPRRPARDGIKARSQRGDIGATWWSRRFVQVLEGLTDGGRLSRGRSYARSGQVIGLTVDAGLVTAAVQGSRRTPYEVRLEVVSLKKKEWARAERAMAERAIFLAALLAGEMPQTIEEAFASSSLSLFPTDSADLVTTCSCPDSANPCKHVAATYYILAEAFDADPFLIFAWRGRAKDELLERLRRLRGVVADDDAGEEPAATDHDAGEPLDGLLDRFWTSPPGLPPLRLDPRAAEMPDAVLRELGAVPGNVVAPLHDRLAPMYETITRAAERRAFGAV